MSYNQSLTRKTTADLLTHCSCSQWYYCRWKYLVSECAKTMNVCPQINCKVKCTLVQALRLCTGRTVRGIPLLFLDHGTRRGWVVSVTTRPLFTHGKDPVPIVQEAGWAPGPVWTSAENLVPTGIRSRTVQSVISRYTDWATGPISPLCNLVNYFFF